MKRKKLLKEIAKLGFRFVRHGGDHDVYGYQTHVNAVLREAMLREISKL